MKVLKAKIKKTSIHYKKGINQKGKSIWLSIVGFNPRGEHNYKIKAVKGIKNGFAEYIDIWVSPNDITIKQHEDGQLSLDIFSPQEMEENKLNPRYANQRRFEYSYSTFPSDYMQPDYTAILKIKNFSNIFDHLRPAIEKFYFTARDIEIARKDLSIYELPKGGTLRQVPRLTKNEINDE